MKKLFTAFLEHKEFSGSRPWSMTRQVFPSGAVSLPHYADTVEILLPQGVDADAYVGGRKYSMRTDAVFFVAPGTVHSFTFSPCGGFMLVMKLSLELLKPFMDLERILSFYHRSLDDIPTVCDKSHDFLEHFLALEKLKDAPPDPASELGHVLAVFRLLARSNAPAPALRNPAEVAGIIKWTEENFGERITLAEASSRFGYTKNYFCDFFKSKTGISYGRYLNTVRISKACELLKKGESVSNTAMLCGLRTESYFISLFKKTVGITPKQYQIKQTQTAG